MILDEIEDIKDLIVKQLSPIKIYLFGSLVNGTFTDDSDIDPYVVVDDDVSDLANFTMQAYKAIRHVKQCPVDILLGTNSRFEERKEFPSVENEVYQKGVLLYERRD